MGNVITLDFSKPALSEKTQQTALAHCFARHRRIGDDVFWLKENAELLNIHETVGKRFSPEAMCAYENFYANVESRLNFFPQYYRFFLSITLDLEALGLDGDVGERLCHYAQKMQLADVELSDLQRAEAARLLGRRGIALGGEDTGLPDRLRRFISRSETFSVPNKKAAYELTHIVFYLSEYGRRDPELSEEAARSLMFAGTLALIDENADLLAEICIALRFARRPVPQAWEDWVQAVRRSFDVSAEATPPIDDYHEFLMSNWHAMVTGCASFEQPMSAERMIFRRSHGHHGVLRAMSEYLYNLAERRVDDWGAMRLQLEGMLAGDAYAHLLEAEAAYPEFDAFFALFARAGG